MIRAKNYEKLFKFVKVTANIMSVLLRGHGVYSRWHSITVDSLSDIDRIELYVCCTSRQCRQRCQPN